MSLKHSIFILTFLLAQTELKEEKTKTKTRLSHEDKHANFYVKCLWKHFEQLSQLSVMSYVMKSTCTLWGGSRWKYVISPTSGPTRARRCWIFFLSSNSLHNSKQMFIDVYIFPYSGSLNCLSKTVRTRTHSVVRRSTQTAVCFTT